MTDFAGDTVVGLVPGRLRGYRGWLLDGSRGKLRSATAKVWWESAHLDAACLRNLMVEQGDYCAPPFEHDPEVMPHKECSCGVHGLHNPADIDNWVHTWLPAVVLGVVEGWGRRVEIGPKGWRAPHARIAALVVPDRPMRTQWVIRDEHLFVNAAYPPQPVRIETVANPLEQHRDRLSAKYGVPAFRSMADLLREFPPIDVKELLKK